jgi:hypothetical protein
VPFAIIRPSDFEFPLFLHVLGALLLMAALMVTATVLVSAWRRSDPREVTALTRFGLWTLLAGVVPSFVLMRLSAEWILDKWDFPEDPDWVGIGYLVSDLGLLLILISIILSIIGLRRVRRGTDRSVLGRIVGVVALFLLVAYAVAVWAMTAKPD